MQFGTLPALIDLHAQSASIGCQTQKARIVFDSRSSGFGFSRKRADQP
jgi:hypothetical protein